MLSTEELYHIDPRALAKMPYIDALVLMRASLWDRKRKLADDMFAATNGDEASAIQREFAKVMKAIDLKDLQLDELR